MCPRVSLAMLLSSSPGSVPYNVAPDGGTMSVRYIVGCIDAEYGDYANTAVGMNAAYGES